MRHYLLPLAFLTCCSPTVAQPKTQPSKEEVAKTEKQAKETATFFGMGALAFVGACAAALFFAMIPAIVALVRGHPNALPITIVSFFFGWTCIGWIACLAWSFTAVEPTVRTRRHRDDYDD